MLLDIKHQHQGITNRDGLYPRPYLVLVVLLLHILLLYFKKSDLYSYDSIVEGTPSRVLEYSRVQIQLHIISMDSTVKEPKLVNQDKPIRGFIFACTDKTEVECLNRLLFAAEQMYGPVVMRIREGDLLFLNNLDTNILYGVFKAVSNGEFNVEPETLGKYPYQVKVAILGGRITITDAEKTLARFSLRRNTPLFGGRLIAFLNSFMSVDKQAGRKIDPQGNNSTSLILEQAEKIKNCNAPVDIEDEIPIIESTTFWDFPKQSYGLTPKGNNKYPGVTPALIIYNMVWRYTNPGDLVVDPMCGSGTTIDVCKEEGRRVIGYDIYSTRPDIIQNDARNIPLADGIADMVFIDSPYSDNLRYNEQPGNIGRISSEAEEFYDELEKVMKESHRILKDGKVLGWLIGDQWVKKQFTPVGFKIYERLCGYFEPVDIICVSRKGQSSNTGMWHNRARRFNFYLRGFKYLIIVRKTTRKSSISRPRTIQWTHYKRG